MLSATGLLLAVTSLVLLQRHRGLAVAAICFAITTYGAWALIAFHIVFPLSSDP